jgi:hypothetical protein
MKAIIFDSSTLISLTMNGLLPELEKLKEIFNGKFIITSQVRKEVIDKPLKIKRYSLEALKIKRLLEIKVLEMSDSLGVSSNDILKKSDEFMDIANTIFRGRGKDIHLISDGESSCLALSKILNEKEVENVLAVDERTTRLLCEKPENLRKIMEGKLHTRLEADTEKYKFFRGYQFIRSAELVYVAWKKKVIKYKNGDVLDALLYAVKFKGCAISEGEISDIKKIG